MSWSELGLPFKVGLAPGIEIQPLGGNTNEWWLMIVNDNTKSDLERVGAFMCLLFARVEMTVALGALDG